MQNLLLRYYEKILLLMSATFRGDYQALEDALAAYGTPVIFNTDQGCQFTSERFTDVLKAHGIQISMDGKGRWMDNVFIERLWRSLKYEEVYLKAYDTVSQAHRASGIGWTSTTRTGGMPAWIE